MMAKSKLPPGGGKSGEQTSLEQTSLEQSKLPPGGGKSGEEQYQQQQYVPYSQNYRPGAARAVSHINGATKRQIVKTTARGRQER